jgi:hypothetical protein
MPTNIYRVPEVANVVDSPPELTKLERTLASNRWANSNLRTKLRVLIRKPNAADLLQEL